MLHHALVRLLSKNPYYAHFIMSFKRRITHSTPTAAVALVRGQIELWVNPDWFFKQSHAGQEDVLIHEVMHIMYLHLARGKKFDDARAFNVAADRAINQLIPNIKEHLPDALLPGPTEKLGLAAEAYYQQAQEDLAGHGELGELDDHGQWGEGISEEVLKEIVRQAHSRAARAAGTIPGDAQIALDLIGNSEIAWRRELRAFIANADEYIRVKTRSRRNRRYGLMQPGSKIESVLHLAVAVDTSGSVGDEELKSFFNEINSLVDLGHKVTLIQADADVQVVSTYSKSASVLIQGRGGTCYGPALKRAEAEKADAVVYFGDMDAADNAAKPSIPVLWISSSGRKAPASFGRTIYLQRGRANAT